MGVYTHGVAIKVANRWYPKRNDPSALQFIMPFQTMNVLEYSQRLQLQPLGLEYVTGFFCDNSQNPQQFQFAILQTGQRVTIPAYSQGVFEILGTVTDMVEIYGYTQGNVDVPVFLLNYVPDSANSIWSVIDPGSVTGAVTVNGAVTILPNTGAMLDGSGTIIAGNVPQVVLPANPTRRFLQIYNLYSSNQILGVSFGAGVNLDTPGLIELVPGGSLIYDGTFCPNQAVYVVGATIGNKFTAKQF